MHGAIGQDLQVEAGPAVQLPPPEDPFKVAEVCGGPLLQPAFILTQPHRGLRQGHAVPQRRKALEIQVVRPQKRAHLRHGVHSCQIQRRHFQVDM